MPRKYRRTREYMWLNVNYLLLSQPNSHQDRHANSHKKNTCQPSFGAKGIRGTKILLLIVSQPNYHQDRHAMHIEKRVGDKHIKNGTPWKHI